MMIKFVSLSFLKFLKHHGVIRCVRVLGLITLLSVPLYSYEFIQSYFQDSDAVALSAVENGRGGYVVLIGVKWGSWYDNIGYGLMEVDSMGNYERYVRIYPEFNGGVNAEEVCDEIPVRVRDSMRSGNYKDGSASEYTHGKIIRLRNGGYFAAVDSVYCYWDWASYDVICEDHLIGYRINDDLGIEWRRNYPASGYVDKLAESRDSGGDIIILSGVGVNFLRIDSVGEIKLNKSYYIRAGDIIEREDKGYVLCGGEYVRGFDSMFNMEWEKNYDTIIIPGGSTLDDWCWIGRIARDIDNDGYKLAGTKVHFDTSGEYIYTGFLLSIDDTGGFEWIKYYDGWREEISMSTVEDGYMVVIQDKDSCPDDTLPYPLWVIGIAKLDSSGNLEWERKFYKCPHEDRYPGWAPLDGRVVNDGYLISGYHGAYDNIAVLIKTDTLGLVNGVGENIFIPSITGPDYIIKSKRDLTQLLRGNPGIRIYDISGREITLNSTYFNLIRGIYLYEDRRSRRKGKILIKFNR